MALLACAACGAARPLAGQAPAVRVGTVGDTVVVTTLTSGLDTVFPVLTARPVVPVWGRDSLTRPSAIVRLADGRIVVADSPRLVVLSTRGALTSVLGRDGAGPGEFRSFDGLAAAGRALPLQPLDGQVPGSRAPSARIELVREIAIGADPTGPD